MSYGVRIGLAGLWVWLLLPVPGAQAREYLVNQGAETLERGEFELELYHDMNFTEADNDDTYNSKHQVELEYGVTDFFQLAYYEVYTWDRSTDWERDGLKIEAKLRLAKPGRWPVDVAFYTEYQNPDGRRSVHSDEIENKLILGKTFGSWTVVGNAVFDKKVNTRSDWEFEYTAGASYALTPLLQVGVEVKETLGDSDEFGWHRADHQLFLIPGISATLTPHLRILVGPAFGLTRASDDLQLKSVVEVEF